MHGLRSDRRRLIGGAAGLAALALGGALPASPSLSRGTALPMLEQIALFRAGEGGYHTYRIPSLLATKGGAVLAFCEGRKAGRGDAGDIDLLMRRSEDGGVTWGPVRVLWNDGANTCGNPCPVVDAATGAISLLLTHNLGHDTEREILDGKSEGTRTVWLMRSADDGKTWTRPANITSGLKRDNWTWYATGPGVGIQMKGGRMIVPCDHFLAGSKEKRSHVVFSDDGGRTWRLGGDTGPDCNECQVVERPDGRLALNMRSYRASHRRLISISSDRGLTWSAPTDDPALIDPVCQAGLIHLPDRAWLFTNPASLKRENLTVRLSPDQGASWPTARTLHSGPAAYSSPAVLPNGNLACLYERGDQGPYETLTLARFNREWLTERP